MYYSNSTILSGIRGWNGGMTNGWVGQAAVAPAPNVAVQQGIIQYQIDQLLSVLSAGIPKNDGYFEGYLWRCYPAERDGCNNGSQYSVVITNTGMPSWTQFWRPDALGVRAGSKLITFTGANYTGTRSEFKGGTFPGPGYRAPQSWGSNTQSAYALPDVDIDAQINKAIDLLTKASTPAGGCVINTSNFDSNPLVTALYAYIDSYADMIKNIQSEAYAIRQKKSDFKTTLLSNILANQAACASIVPGAVAPAPVGPAAPAARKAKSSRRVFREEWKYTKGYGYVSAPRISTSQLLSGYWKG